MREFWFEDLDGIRAWAVDDEITRNLSGAFLKPQTPEQTEEYLRNMMGGGSGANFVVAERPGLGYLGQVSIMMVDNLARKGELAFVFKREHTHQGYGYEAGQMLIDFAFRQMNLNRVYLKVQDENVNAIRLYEKLGFRHEGRLREDYYRDGKYGDLLVMGLLRDEWHRGTPL